MSENVINALISWYMRSPRFRYLFSTNRTNAPVTFPRPSQKRLTSCPKVMIYSYMTSAGEYVALSLASDERMTADLQETATPE